MNPIPQAAPLATGRWYPKPKVMRNWGIAIRMAHDMRARSQQEAREDRAMRRRHEFESKGFL